MTRCLGNCCERFAFGRTHEDITRIMNADEEFKAAGFPDALIRLGEFDFWPEDPFHQRAHQPPKMEHYRCAFFDKETRNCTNYEKRPNFCRTHGEEYACTYYACCRNDSLRVTGGCSRPNDRHTYGRQATLYAKALPPSSGVVELPYPAVIPHIREMRAFHDLKFRRLNKFTSECTEEKTEEEVMEKHIFKKQQAEFVDVSLTDQEVLTFATRAADTRETIEKTEEEMKATAKKFKESIDKLKASMKYDLKVVKTRTEQRHEQCELRIDLKDETTKVFFKNEMIESHVITKGERQYCKEVMAAEKKAIGASLNAVPEPVGTDENTDQDIAGVMRSETNRKTKADVISH